MNKLNRMLMIAAAAQVLLVVLVFANREKSGVEPLLPVIGSLDKAAVTRVQIFDQIPSADNGGKTSGKTSGKASNDTQTGAVIDLAKSGNEWQLASHFNYPVKPGKVDEFLTTLAGLQARGAVTDNSARYAGLDVADDKYQRKLVISQNGKPDITLWVGGPAGASRNAVRLEGRTAVRGVSNFSPWQVSVQPNGWVETKIFEVANDEVADITVQNRTGIYKLTKNGEEWTMQKDGAPIVLAKNEKFDQTTLRGLASTATSMHLVAPADPARKIDNPDVTITIGMKPKEPQSDPKSPSIPASLPSVPQSTTIKLQSDSDMRYLLSLEPGQQRPVLVSATLVEKYKDLSIDTVKQKTDTASHGPEDGKLDLQQMPPGAQLPPEVMERVRMQRGAAMPKPH